MREFSINSLHTALREKKYSVSDVVQSFRSRIEQSNKEINALITTTFDYAHEMAKNQDEIIAHNPHAFEEFPLLGVVFSIKDLFLTQNIRTTAGSKVLSDFIPAYSATVVDRLEKAGAIIIGKANCDAWAHGASGENSEFGVTKNPWNYEFVPGGSSSGSAAAVSAGFSFASTGTDTGGSIRQPASFTNLVGFKPTYGAVSRYGVIAMASSLDSMGHFTHTVEDSEKIFAVTRGKDGKDSTIVEKYNFSTPKTIGIAKEYIEGLHPDVEKVFNETCEKLEQVGYTIKEISLPHMKYAVSVYYIVQPAEVSSNLNRYDGVRYGNTRDNFGKEAKRRIMLGTYVLSSGYYDAYYLKAMKVRSLIIKDFREAFEKVDAILTPTAPTPPFKIGERSSDPLQMYLSDIFTVSANLAGIPGISIPAGFSSKSLPIGMQILGPQFGEDRLFEIAKKFQSETDWHTQTPIAR